MLAATAMSDTIATAHSKTVGESLKFLLKRNSQYLNPIVTTHTTFSSHTQQVYDNTPWISTNRFRQANNCSTTAESRETQTDSDSHDILTTRVDELVTNQSTIRATPVMSNSRAENRPEIMHMHRFIL